MTSTITANGAAIAYRFDGPENAPVVVMSNSLLSNLSMWDPQIAVLGERFRVLRYDTRGHGESETTPGPYSIELLAGDVVGLLDALDIQRVHFVGISMGGMIGQYLGARHGGRIASLTLCDTASEMPPPALWNERIAMAEQKGIAVLVQGTLERWFLHPFLDNEKAKVAQVRDMILTTKPQGYAACAGAIRDMSQTALLADIRCPAAIIVGAEDPACPVSAAQVLHDHIAGASLTILEDAGHLPNIEQPDAFNQALMAFLTAR